MARARNMQKLTDEVKTDHPGVVVYGIGDEAHKLRASAHNEDDTKGSKPNQEDSDNKAEHRGIDVMVGKAFNKADGDALVGHLLKYHKNRLNGIIWYGKQWWRSTGFKEQARTTDQHKDHVHIEGLASDDENVSSWFANEEGEEEMSDFCALKDQGRAVTFLQYRLNVLGFNLGPSGVDGEYGPAVAAAVKAACKSWTSSYNGSGESYGPLERIYLDALWATKYAKENAKPGPAGPKGKDGTNGKDGRDGRDGVLVLPESITLEAVIQPAPPSPQG